MAQESWGGDPAAEAAEEGGGASEREGQRGIEESQEERPRQAWEGLGRVWDGAFSRLMWIEGVTTP